MRNLAAGRTALHALAVLLGIAIAGAAAAQDAQGAVPGMAEVLGEALSQASGALSGGPAEAGGSGSVSGRIIQTIGLLTVLSVAPALLVVMTSFTRFVIVFSMLRMALGLQQTPPNMVLTSLALFMTFFVMQPVFQDAWDDGLAPLLEGEIREEQAIGRIAEPFHAFMRANVRADDVALFMARAQAGAAPGEEIVAQEAVPQDRAEIPWSVLVPAFVISELRAAFLVGFLIAMPFIVIDLVVASVLMSAGMMMLPPVMISLPFKVIFFVLIDGWHRLAGSLMESYAGVL